VFYAGASLKSGTHLGSDPYFNGVVLDVEGGGELKLAVAAGGTDLATYHLAFRATPADAFADPCAGGVAVPLAGRWTRRGLHEADPAHISFACSEGVASKCTLWGFVAGDDPTSMIWTEHQACTRMARADYCANGIPHTRNGTHIHIYDRLGIAGNYHDPLRWVVHWPPDPNAFVYEAAWSGGDKPASCVSRTRWQSMPIDGVCETPDVVPDPRANRPGQFCDDIDTTSVVMFDTSMFSDLELYRWHAGDDYASTVRGYYDESNATVDKQPFPMLPVTYTMDPKVDRDCMLLRRLTEDMNTSDFTKVSLYRKGTDSVIAIGTGVELDGYDWVADEGFVARAPFTGSVKLNLYYNPTTQDLLSSCLEPPPGYQLQHPIGFTLPAEDAQGGSAQIRTPAHH
jgi:ADYC domain-containing protein